MALPAMSEVVSETLIPLTAAWLLLAGASVWARRERLQLSSGMLIASGRGLVQLLVLAWVLQWIFAIQSYVLMAVIVLVFCILAGHNSARYHVDHRRAWIAASAGLACGCLVTLPWLSLSGAIASDTRHLIPLGSMIAANGMNAVSIMFERMKTGGEAAVGIRTAMIPTVDTLRVVGLVHMPGIFVDMILAGSPPLAAASAQLVVLYMIVTSSFTACVVSRQVIGRPARSDIEGKPD